MVFVLVCVPIAFGGYSSVSFWNPGSGSFPREIRLQNSPCYGVIVQQYSITLRNNVAGLPFAPVSWSIKASPDRTSIFIC